MGGRACRASVQVECYADERKLLRWCQVALGRFKMSPREVVRCRALSVHRAQRVGDKAELFQLSR